MPVKANKKTISQKKRKEIHDAASSIPGLIIEHVAFGHKASSGGDEDNRPNKRYMLSDEKRRERQKKTSTVAIGVGIVLIVLGILWVINLKTFFFDSKHSTSIEQEILNAVKTDFKETVGTVTKDRPTIASSTENVIETANLQAALIAGLASASASSTTSSTVVVPQNTTTTTTSTAVSEPTSTEPHFPIANDSTTTTTEN